MSRALPWLGPAGSPLRFPPPEAALREPDGLLAAGGDLAPERLLAAYRRGIFPWYEAGQPILWWSPDPRTVIFPHELHVPRRFRRELAGGTFTASCDNDFAAVIRACARRDDPEQGTWITPEMITAYERLHALGHAHSVETWRDDTLVGGLYGVAVGRAFCAESMFSRVSNGSRAALTHLAAVLEAHGFRVIDCQLPSPHLARLGARDLPRREFLALLETCLSAPPPPPDCWSRRRVPVRAPNGPH